MEKAKQLKEEMPGAYISFAGGGLSKNRFFEKEVYPFKDIACGYFPWKKPITCLASLGKMFKGVLQSFRYLRKIKPDIVVGFGSYHTFPLLLAARLKNSRLDLVKVKVTLIFSSGTMS